MNDGYTKALQEFTISADPFKYIVVGSVALLSHTQKFGYDREIHDIDIVMEKTSSDITKQNLIDLGYKLETFINPRMPFYKSFIKHAKDRYLRLTKNGLNIEILATQLYTKNHLVCFELYPGIRANFPEGHIVASSFNGVSFTTLTPEMIYFIKKISNNTFGKISKYKEQQRLIDLRHIKKLVKQDTFIDIGKRSRIAVGPFIFKIPRSIYHS